MSRREGEEGGGGESRAERFSQRASRLNIAFVDNWTAGQPTETVLAGQPSKTVSLPNAAKGYPPREPRESLVGEVGSAVWVWRRPACDTSNRNSMTTAHSRYAARLAGLPPEELLALAALGCEHSAAVRAAATAAWRRTSPSRTGRATRSSCRPTCSRSCSAGSSWSSTR